jgi:hypothetical protein
LVALALACAVAVPARGDDAPYVPPPFTEFPDEPAQLPPRPPVRSDDPWENAWVDALRTARLRVLAGADAPLEVTAGLELALPFIHIGTTFGELPRSVEREVNSELIAHGAYAQSLGDLVVASMQRVILWRGYVALQPWPHHGLLATAGAGVTWVHGNATVPQVAEAIHMAIPDGAPVDNVHFDITSQIHLVDLELGWEWHVARHALIRLGLGAALATSAPSRATLQPAIADPRLVPYAERAATTLDHALTTYVKLPLISILVGYEL